MKVTSPQSVPDGESSSAGMKASTAAETKAASVAVSASKAAGSARAAATAVGAVCASPGTVEASPVASAVPAPTRKRRRGIESSVMTFSLMFFIELP